MAKNWLKIPILEVTEENAAKLFAIAAAPPKYFSENKSLKTRTGSFPDFPKDSQKIY